MAIEIIVGKDRCALYDTVTGIAFGPTFEFEENAEDYLSFCRHQGPMAKPQNFSAAHHQALHDRWFSERVDPDSGLLREEFVATPET